MRLIIKAKEKFDSYVVQYQGLGGNDDTFINSNSITMIKAEIKRLAKEKADAVDEFTNTTSKPKSKPKNPQQNKIDGYFK